MPNGQLSIAGAELARGGVELARPLAALGGGVISAGMPQIWYDGRDLNGPSKFNAGLTNGGTLKARRNLGTYGAAWDQGAGLNGPLTALLPPTVLLPAQAGKIAGCGSIHGTGTQYMQTAPLKYNAPIPLPTQLQPYTIVSVFKATDLAATYYLYTGAVAGAEAELVINFGGAGKVQLNNGGGFADTGQVVVAGQWNTSIAVVNGANSRHYLNGVASGLLNLNAVQFTGVCSLSGTGGSGFFLKGDEAVHMRWISGGGTSGVQPDPTDIHALLVNWFGAFPQ